MTAAPSNDEIEPARDGGDAKLLGARSSAAAVVVVAVVRDEDAPHMYTPRAWMHGEGELRSLRRTLSFGGIV